MAGKGTEIGRTFEELAQIIDGVKLNENYPLLFDTCHTNDAGYNIKEDFSGVMEEFDKIIGLDRLKVLHINDSKIRKVRIKTGTPILVLEQSDSTR